MSFTTRLYLTSATASYAPATKRGAWDLNTSTLIQALQSTKSGSAAAQTVTVGNTGAAYDVLFGRWVSPALTANLAFASPDTVQWVVGVRESNGNLNGYWHVYIYVTTGDSDTPRSPALLTDNYGVTEFTTTATGRGEGTKTLGSVAAQTGDHIVVEIGYRASSTNASYTGSMHYANTGSTDLTQDNTNVTTQPGWVQFVTASPLFGVSQSGLSALSAIVTTLLQGARGVKGAVVLSAAIAVSSIATITGVAPTAVLAVTTNVSATSSVARSARSSLSGIATLQATCVQGDIRVGSCNLPCGSVFASSSKVTRQGQCALAGTGTVVSTAIATRSASGSLVCASGLAGRGAVTRPGSGSLTCASTVGATSKVTHPALSSLTSSSTLNAIGSTTRELSGLATLASSAMVVSRSTVRYVGTSSIIASATSLSTSLVTHVGRAFLPTSIAVATSGGCTRIGATILPVTSVLGVSGSCTRNATSSFVTSATLASCGMLERLGRSVLTGTGVLSTFATTTHNAVGQLGTHVGLGSCGAVEYFGRVALMVSGKVDVTGLLAGYYSGVGAPIPVRMGHTTSGTVVVWSREGAVCETRGPRGVVRSTTR